MVRRMATLTSLLLSQHRAIGQHLARVQKAADGRDLALIQLELPALKTALATHLHLEDGELYPGLLRMAKQLGDAHLTTLAEAYAQSIPQLSKGVLGLLARHERRVVLEPFLKDWSTVIALVRSRIRSEEGSLFGTFDSAHAKLIARASPTLEF